MPHVFISYVREDSSVVDRLIRELKRSGVQVWLDRSDIAPGERWRSAIRRAIREGDFFLACFSSAYAVKSRSYMNEELTLAIEELRQRPSARSWFIPILLSNCELPDRDIGGGETLNAIQHMALHRDWKGEMAKLREVLGTAVPRSDPDIAIRKRGFRSAQLPRGWNDWNEYFCSELESAGLIPIHYNGYQVAAHEVCDLHTNTAAFETKRADQASPYVNRFAAEGKPAAHKHQFTPKEIGAFGKRIGQNLKNDPAAWTTGFKFESSRHCATIYWEEIDYFRAYVLCNQIYYQQHKFEHGPEAQWDFPFFLLRDNFREFGRHNYSVWAVNPAVLGLDVILETRDEKCVLQRRSSKTATHGGRIAPLGAGYEPSDFRGGADPLTTGVIREMKSELGLGGSEFELRPIGLFHVVPSNELNFVAHTITHFAFEELKQRVKERVPPERWEYKNLIGFRMEDVLGCSGPWKVVLAKMSVKERDRAVMASYYCCRTKRYNGNAATL